MRKIMDNYLEQEKIEKKNKNKNTIKKLIIN